MKSPVTRKAVEAVRRQYQAGVNQIDAHIAQLEAALARARENRLATLGSVAACDHLLRLGEKKPDPATK